MGIERPVLRTGSITLLRYVSLPNGPYLRAFAFPMVLIIRTIYGI